MLARVNAACRQGRYNDDLWKELTGKSLPELNEEWKAALQKEIAQSHLSLAGCAPLLTLEKRTFSNPTDCRAVQIDNI